MADDNGFYDGVVVNADTVDLCYRHIASDGTVVGCALLQRQQ
jgi:hypothetical protein